MADNFVMLFTFADNFVQLFNLADNAFFALVDNNIQKTMYSFLVYALEAIHK